MTVMKKILKTIGKILLGILALLVLTLLITTIIHNFKLKSNKALMAEHGFYNPVSTGEHSLNLVDYGGAENGHRIIALSGNGTGFPIELQKLAGELTDENHVYYLARAGYDGSDDVKEEMTLEFIVEDYRKALQSAGIEAPYVLVPHSYASLPVTYWVNQYPDEVEAVISLDGMVAVEVTDEDVQDAEAEMGGGLNVMKTMMRLGLGDAAPHMFFMEYEDYTAEEQRISDAMGIMTMSSNAFASQMSHMPSGMKEVWDTMQPNSVPKLYINVENGYRSVEELEADDVLSEYRINEMTEGFEGSAEERRQMAYEKELQIKQEYVSHCIQPFIEKLGNCKVVDLPGDHFTFYYEKAEKCGEIIRNYLDSLS